MGRLIDADKLIKDMQEIIDSGKANDAKAFLFTKFVVETEAVFHQVDGLEPVVKCKDCKYFVKLQPDYPDGCRNDSVSIWDVTPDFYCACGERRSE